MGFRVRKAHFIGPSVAVPIVLWTILPIPNLNDQPFAKDASKCPVQKRYLKGQADGARSTDLSGMTSQASATRGGPGSDRASPYPDLRPDLHRAPSLNTPENNVRMSS
jgi:hypothetical protein